MRIGAILRCDNSGLGIQSKEFFDHIPCKALVIDENGTWSNMQQNYDWFPGQQVFQLKHKYAVHGGKRQKIGLEPIPESVISEFIRDIDILFVIETPYDYKIFQLCKRRRIKTILQLNYEFLEYPSNLAKPDLFAAPSMWHYEDIPDPKIFLPVPVNTNHLIPQRKEKTFVHIAGKPAVHDRNGTQSFLSCLKYVKNEITVILNCQIGLDIPVIPPNVTLITDFSNKKDYWENYTGGVLVLPRKYAGLSLPVNEAIAAEMPVIMTDISPNNLWLPKEWLVPAKQAGSFRCKKLIDIFEADSEALAAKIDEFCEPDVYNRAIEQAKDIKQKISWEALLPVYEQAFKNLIGHT